MWYEGGGWLSSVARYVQQRKVLYYYVIRPIALSPGFVHEYATPLCEAESTVKSSVSVGSLLLPVNNRRSSSTQLTSFNHGYPHSHYWAVVFPRFLQYTARDNAPPREIGTG